MDEDQAGSPAQTRKTRNGAVFSLGAYGITRALNLLVTVMLARSLGPEGMGLIAAALLVVEVIDMARGLGLKETLIYDRTGSAHLQTTAFLIIMGVAFVQAGALFLAAPFAVAYVDDALIVPMLMWFALLFPVTAIGTVPEAVLNRNLRFVATSVAEIAGVIVKASVAIALIWQGFGVWSMVAGMLSGVMVRSALYGGLAGWRPVRPLTDKASLLGLLGYGKHIFLSSLLNFFKMRADQLVIVLAMGDAALGVYFVASRIPDIIITGVNSALTKVIFPTFSKMSDSRERLTEMYLVTLGGSMLVMAPLSIGLMAIAPQAVPALFGQQWMESVPVLIALAASGIFQTVGWTVGDVFKATGRPHLLSLLMIVQIFVTLPLVLTAAVLTGDIVWIAVAIAAGEGIMSAIRLWYMQRVDRVSAWRTVLAASRPITAAAAMGLVVLGVAALLSDVQPGLRLFASVAAGAIVYPPLVFLIDRENVLRWAGPRRRAKD